LESIGSILMLLCKIINKYRATVVLWTWIDYVSIYKLAKLQIFRKIGRKRT